LKQVSDADGNGHFVVRFRYGNARCTVGRACALGAHLSRIMLPLAFVVMVAEITTINVAMHCNRTLFAASTV